MADNYLTQETVRIDEIARFVGVSVRRIQQLTQEGIIRPEIPPGKERGTVYRFLPTIQALMEYYREKADKKRTGDSDEMAEEKLRQIAAKRALDELKLSRAKSELHHTKDVEKVFGSILTRLRVGLLSLPMSIAPAIANETDVNKIAGIVEDRITRVSHELVSFDFKTFVESGGAAYIAAIEAEEAETEGNDGSEE